MNKEQSRKNETKKVNNGLALSDTTRRSHVTELIRVRWQLPNSSRGVGGAVRVETWQISIVAVEVLY